MLENETPTTVRQTVEGRVIYLLLLVVFVQSIYPITAGNHPIPVIIYQLFYASLLVAGIVVARESPLVTRLLVVLAFGWLVVGSIYAFNPHAIWAQLAGYAVIAPFQIVVTAVLVVFIFKSHRVTRDVIYAACAVYLLLGAIFVPVYGMIETIHFATSGGEHAFNDAAVIVGQPFPWQTFIYYSYATLTTLGYGDVLPLTMWARSASSLQAMIGVLYTAIVISRLIGLYAGQEVEEFEQAHHRADQPASE